MANILSIAALAASKVHLLSTAGKVLVKTGAQVFHWLGTSNFGFFGLSALFSHFHF